MITFLNVYLPIKEEELKSAATFEEEAKMKSETYKETFKKESVKQEIPVSFPVLFFVYNTILFLYGVLWNTQKLHKSEYFSVIHPGFLSLISLLSFFIAMIGLKCFMVYMFTGFIAFHIIDLFYDGKYLSYIQWRHVVFISFNIFWLYPFMSMVLRGISLISRGISGAVREVIRDQERDL